MTVINRTASFLGKGLAWPIRINPATGGIQMSEGNFDDIPVALSFVPDQGTIQEDVFGRQNKLRESMGHILSTQIGEYDFLPEFGSRPSAIIHDPNSQYARMEYETWAELATARWEKRVRMKAPQNFSWSDNEDEADQGMAVCKISPEIIPTQVPGNLVTPFVNARDCRAQEFPLGEVDSEGHDWASRYHGQTAYQVNGERYLRARKVMPIDHAPDDGFYTVLHGDTWLTISWELYRDVRFDWVIQDYYTNDAAEAGVSRSKGLKITEELEPGTLLRYPSKARILTQMAA
jgi:phage baseplate assembly protein W